MRGHVEHQRRFAHTRIAAQQSERTGDDSSAKHTIEFRYSARDPRSLNTCNFGKPDWR